MRNNFFIKKNKSVTFVRMNFSKPLTEQSEDLLLLEETESLKSLILFNDDVNTFDFVIQTLVEICGHQILQAEQCAYLVHYTGKCAVKKANFDTLKPMCEALLEKGLSATIEA
jgi:ATP-dependent Clp protease adaptor protein ClpS